MRKKSPRHQLLCDRCKHMACAVWNMRKAIVSLPEYKCRTCIDCMNGKELDRTHYAKDGEACPNAILLVLEGRV